MLIRRNTAFSKSNRGSPPNDLLPLREPQQGLHQEAPLLHYPSHPLNPESPISSVLIADKRAAPVVGVEKEESEFSFKQNCLLSQENPQCLEDVEAKHQQNLPYFIKTECELFEPSQTSRQDEPSQTSRIYELKVPRGKRSIGMLTNTPKTQLLMSQVSDTAESVIRKPINSSQGGSRLDDLLNKIKSLRMTPLQENSQQSQRYTTNRYEQSKAESTDTSGEEVSPIKKSVITSIRKHVQRMNISLSKNHRVTPQESDNEDHSFVFKKPSQTKGKAAAEELLHSKNKSFLVRTTNKKTKKESETVIVSYRTTVLELKELCGRYEDSMNLKVTVPRSFLKPLFDPLDTQEDMFAKAACLLEDLGVRSVQPMTIRKYSNCIIVLIDCLALISYFSGHTYFGGWQQGGKNGLGLQWLPGKFVYYGQYVSNKREGCGVLKDYKGEVQLGEWKENKFINNSPSSKFC